MSCSLGVVKVMDQADAATWAQVCGQLRARRKALGITQVELVHMLGLTTKSTVCNWERGRNTPHAGNLTRWARVLGLELFVGEPAVTVDEEEEL